MQLKVNGNTCEMKDGADGAALLASFGVNPQTVVVELNGEIIRREEFLAHSLADGDVVELVTLVGGG